MVSLTATAAVFWEFGEFTIDQMFGTNVQVSLANTMQDMAMGIFGGFVSISIRSRQLRVGISEVRQITLERMRGQAV